jgi:hypothetical protein
MERESVRASANAGSDGILDRVFLDHPRSLGETYWQHQRRAWHFGISMVGAGMACLVHALVPAVFDRTASRAVQRLHDEMSATRRLDGIAPARARVIHDAVGRTRPGIPGGHSSAARSQPAVRAAAS